MFELALSLRIKTELRNAALEALREGIEELEESEDVEQHLRSHLFEVKSFDAVATSCLTRWCLSAAHRSR